MVTTRPAVTPGQPLHKQGALVYFIGDLVSHRFFFCSGPFVVEGVEERVDEHRYRLRKAGASVAEPNVYPESLLVSDVDALVGHVTRVAVSAEQHLADQAAAGETGGPNHE